MKLTKMVVNVQRCAPAHVDGHDLKCSLCMHVQDLREEWTARGRAEA